MRIDRIGQNAVYFNIPGTIPAQLRDTPLILDMRLLVRTALRCFLTGLDSFADEKSSLHFRSDLLRSSLPVWRG